MAERRFRIFRRSSEEDSEDTDAGRQDEEAAASEAPPLEPPPDTVEDATRSLFEREQASESPAEPAVGESTEEWQMPGGGPEQAEDTGAEPGWGPPGGQSAAAQADTRESDAARPQPDAPEPAPEAPVAGSPPEP